jgi:hypothetical protein
MMNKENWQIELIEGMKKLSKEGFKCYIYDGETWGYFITPQDNVIYIQRDTFEWRGWTTSLQYIPNRDSGSGCRCEEEPFQAITKEQILECEVEGLKLARRLKAELYKSSNQWFNKYWNKEKLIEIN